MHTNIKLAIAGAAGVAVGALVGWKVTERHLAKVYDELLAEELKSSAEFFKQVYKAEEYETPEKAAEFLYGDAADAAVAVAADTVINYHGKFVPVENTELVPGGVLVKDTTPVEESPVAPPEEQDHNIWADAPDAYLISMDEFNANETEYEQISATYFELDSVVTDDEDKPLADVDRCVGIGNLAQYGDGTVIYVRNDRLEKDYMINKSTGSYAKEVLDLDGPEDELHHSDTFAKMPRRRRLRDE